jgi:hypothetical protein
MTTLIKYDGRIAAIASRARVHFCPPLHELDAGDPLRRFVHIMGRYARDIATGALPGDYSDEDAELYARTALIDDDDFHAVAGEPDAELAARFNVPLEQIARKRSDPA